MATEEAVISVFGAFLALPEGKHYLDTGKHISADVFLKIPTVAKELFRNEPGCAVKYKAIEEKIKVLEPHLKVTLSGPKLMAFFNELRKFRNKWAVAFANYESHVVMAYLNAQECENKSPDFIERRATNAEEARLVLRGCLDAAEKKFSDMKSSHEFARYVQILEACIKKHKIHLQRKAHAEKMREILAKKKKKIQVKKAKKAVFANTAQTQPYRYTQSVFNPDLPDFAQFMKGYTNDAPAAPTGTTNKDLQHVTRDGAKATKAVSSTNLATEKQHPLYKIGGEESAVPVRTRVEDFSGKVGTGDTTVPPNASNIAAIRAKDKFATATADLPLQEFTTIPLTNDTQGTTVAPQMLETSDLQLEKVLRAELGMDMPEYLAATEDIPPALKQTKEQATEQPEQSNAIEIAGESERTDELGAFWDSTLPSFDPSTFISTDSTELAPMESDLFDASGFNMDHELINGEFGSGLTLDEPLLGNDPYQWPGFNDFPVGPLSLESPPEDDEFYRQLFGIE
jgi:hypothetical protein